MQRAATTEEIRAWAMALPEVTEKRHVRFHVPVWQVHGKTFLGMGRDEATAVFCIGEDSARAAVIDDPEHTAAVGRSDARRSYLGLEVQRAGVPSGRIEAPAREAWASQAPRALVKQHADDR